MIGTVILGYVFSSPAMGHFQRFEMPPAAMGHLQRFETPPTATDSPSSWTGERLGRASSASNSWTGERLGRASSVNEESDGPGFLWNNIKDELGIEHDRRFTLAELEAVGNHDDFENAVDQIVELHDWMDGALVQPIEDRDWGKLEEAVEDPMFQLLAGSSDSSDSGEFDIYTLPALHKWLGDDFLSHLQARDFESAHAALLDDPYNMFTDFEESEGPIPDGPEATPRDCNDIDMFGDWGEATVYPFEGDIRYPVQVTCRSSTTLVAVEPTSNYGYNERKRLKDGWRCSSMNSFQDDWNKAGRTAFSYYVLVVDRDTGSVHIDASDDDDHEAGPFYFNDAFTSETDVNIAPGHGASCFSWNGCESAKKGEFSVDLQGTGLGISSDARWKVTGWGNGKKTVANYVRTDTKRSGNCGAWCGECGPENDKIFVTPAGLPDWTPSSRR